MTRVRVVSLRSFDPLIAGLSPAAFRAWQRSLDWSFFHGTDGLLTPADIKSIGPTPSAKKELLERGVWKVDEDGRTFVAELREGPVVAEVEGCKVEHRPTNADRQKRYRERKLNAVTRVTPETVTRAVTDNVTRDVTGVTGGIQGGSGSESSPDPEASSSVLASDSELLGSARVQRNRRRSALPADWKPTEEHIKRASKTGLDLDRESIRFRSHHEAKGSLMANWNAAFTTWLLNAVEWGKPPGAIQHEKTRQEESRRPYHELFKPEPIEPKASPAEALEAIQRAAAGIGRRV